MSFSQQTRLKSTWNYTYWRFPWQRQRFLGIYREPAKQLGLFNLLSFHCPWLTLLQDTETKQLYGNVWSNPCKKDLSKPLLWWRQWGHLLCQLQGGPPVPVVPAQVCELNISTFWERRNTMIKSPLKQTKKPTHFGQRSQDGWWKEARSSNIFRWQLKSSEEEHPLPLCSWANWVPFALRQSRSTDFLCGSLSHDSWFENGCGTITSSSHPCLLGV